MNMIERNTYLDKIKDYIDNPMIKVLKGIRRSSKTELLKMIMNEIKSNGVKATQIIYINYESFSSLEYRDSQTLYKYIENRSQEVDDKFYIFLDEIQEVEAWEKDSKRSEKFYLADLGIRTTVLGYKENDISQMLENIVFLELRRRGYEVYIGKIGDYEVDFVAMKNGERSYFQVSYSILDEVTAKREYRSLEMIDDNYDKYILTMDTLDIKGKKGIGWMNIIDFLDGDTWEH